MSNGCIFLSENVPATWHTKIQGKIKVWKKKEKKIPVMQPFLQNTQQMSIQCCILDGINLVVKYGFIF